MASFTVPSVPSWAQLVTTFSQVRTSPIPMAKIHPANLCLCPLQSTAISEAFACASPVCSVASTLPSRTPTPISNRPIHTRWTRISDPAPITLSVAAVRTKHRPPSRERLFASFRASLSFHGCGRSHSLFSSVSPLFSDLPSRMTSYPLLCPYRCSTFSPPNPISAALNAISS